MIKTYHKQLDGTSKRYFQFRWSRIEGLYIAEDECHQNMIQWCEEFCTDEFMYDNTGIYLYGELDAMAMRLAWE